DMDARHGPHFTPYSLTRTTSPLQSASVFLWSAGSFRQRSARKSGDGLPSIPLVFAADSAAQHSSVNVPSINFVFTWLLLLATSRLVTAPFSRDGRAQMRAPRHWARPRHQLRVPAHLISPAAIDKRRIIAALVTDPEDALAGGDRNDVSSQGRQLAG